ncbi:hypothetical protein [Radiobacillus deserti]|uniref:Arylamine N-acetyltransferase n=1 Tax=Radiobacillus deserti TaxID=2594883 RepID=A0A516KCX3_9BACI|nr:hypothetical protein [Radiobacillus deserti]QDP39254.1 hypothetical protein FN924_03000 [Radiobacillus deserti]
MMAPQHILNTWRKFDSFPMETLTKAWRIQRGQSDQRNIALLKEDYARYGISGNCFDLAVWLMEAFKEAGVKAYPIGDRLNSEEAHAAVIAQDEDGNRYLCDLGDQWIQPILIQTNTDKLSGFFPAADVQLYSHDSKLEVVYHRPNGKTSRQFYDTSPVPYQDFLSMAHKNQKRLRPDPLVEMRIPHHGEIAHWEFSDWTSFWSTNSGIQKETKLYTVEDWVERLHNRTGYDRTFLEDALSLYM